MIKLKIKGKILCLTLATGAITIMALGTSSYLGLNNISFKLLEWESQSSVSASNMLENLSSSQSKHSLEIIAHSVASHFSARLRSRINDVQQMSDKLTFLSSHPDQVKPRVLPEPQKQVIHSGEAYINYGFLRQKPLDPAIKRRAEILSNIADYMSAQRNSYRHYPASIFACSEDGFTINLDLQSDEKEAILTFEQNELNPNYDLRKWPSYIFTKNSDATVISEMYLKHLGARLFSICMPFYDRNGFAGIAGIDLKLSRVFDNLEISRILSGVDYFVVDHKGKIIFSSLMDGDLTENQLISEKRSSRSKELNQALDEMCNGGKKTVEVKLNNDMYYMSYAPILECNWSFAVVEKIRDANSQVSLTKKQLSASMNSLRTSLDSGLQNLDYVLTGLLLVLMCVIVYAAIKQSERFTKPILKLVASVDMVSQGHLDSLVQIRTGDEFEELASKFNQMTLELKKHMQETGQVTAEKEHIATELSVATKIQQSMLPQNFPSQRERYDLYALSIPAKEVGGDFYDFYKLDADHLAVTIADVSGKGVPAALFMVISKTILKNNALMMTTSSSLAKAVDRANLQLYQDNHEDMFVTVFIGVLDLRNGHFNYVSAGHNPPLLSRSNGYRYLPMGQPRPMLGVLDEISYVQEQLDLKAGDTLFLYTDGVTEAMDEQGEQFGTERLCAVLNERVEVGLKEQSELVLKSVRSFAGTAEQSDDITMLSLRYIGSNVDGH